MEIPNLAIDKESQNLCYIYLFYVEAKWWAFGYSAYYLNIIYPVLVATNKTDPEHEGGIPCVHVPDSFLVRLSEFYSTLVSDKYIQVEAPPTAYCYRPGYDEWYEKLTVN